MPKAIDETGKQYKNFIVIQKDLAKTKEKRRAFWICECQQCKTQKSISGTHLRDGKFICDVCAEREKYRSEIGKTYGNLTIIDFAYKTEDRHLVWKCQCQCGNIENIKGTELNTGKRTCCLECNKQYHKIQPTFIDETGNIYGLLTVIKRDPDPKFSKTAHWICQCKCGNICSVAGTHLRDGHTQSCGCTRQSHGEIKIAQLLTQNNIPFVQEFQAFKFNDTNMPARFDFFVNNKYLIEFDGETHFNTNLGGWHTVEQVTKQQEHDLIKTNWCIANNYTLIRIPYTILDSLTIQDILPETSQYITYLGS